MNTVVQYAEVIINDGDTPWPCEVTNAARRRLGWVTDPLTRVLLDLHSEDERGQCKGCDFDGYDAERPGWPCRTVETVAAHYGIELETP